MGPRLTKGSQEEEDQGRLSLSCEASFCIVHPRFSQNGILLIFGIPPPQKNHSRCYPFWSWSEPTPPSGGNQPNQCSGFAFRRVRCRHPLGRLWRGDKIKRTWEYERRKLLLPNCGLLSSLSFLVLFNQLFLRVSSDRCVFRELHRKLAFSLVVGGFIGVFHNKASLTSVIERKSVAYPIIALKDT